MTTEKATFAGGCFWQTEAEFRSMPGVTATQVGYTGGRFSQPTYHDVCSGKTGHAEAVEVEFDPTKVTYDQLLDAFWRMHNPTTKNRQGWDIGTQYRSAIFTHSEEQALVAKHSMERAQEQHRKRIVTEIEPAEAFWSAEDYHQRYLEKRGLATCAIPGATEEELNAPDR